MAEETKAEAKKVEKEDALATPVVAEAVAFDKPEDPTADVKHKADERVVVDPEGEIVTRKATFAEQGFDTAKEDMSKFIPPVAPSNAPQPKTYVGGIRIDHVPSETEASALKEEKKK